MSLGLRAPKHSSGPPGCVSRVHEWLEANGQAHLAQPKHALTPDMASTLTVLATRITKATGFYRGSGASDVLITFGPVTITWADGRTQTVDISVE